MKTKHRKHLKIQITFLPGSEGSDDELFEHSGKQNK